MLTADPSPTAPNVRSEEVRTSVVVVTSGCLRSASDERPFAAELWCDSDLVESSLNKTKRSDKSITKPTNHLLVSGLSRRLGSIGQ